MPEASKPVASSADKPRHRRQKRLLRSASRYATAYGRDADLSHAPSAPEASSPPAVRLDFLSLTITVGGAWHPARSTYLFPVRARSRHFRGGFVSRLRCACEAGQLSRLRNRAEVDRVLKALIGTEWVVYSKPCLGRTETVVDYLGRYSHRIALSDSRLLAFDGESVELDYQDYRDGGQHKTMTLTGEELIRRFLFLRSWASKAISKGKEF